MFEDHIVEAESIAVHPSVDKVGLGSVDEQVCILTVDNTGS